MKRLFLVLSIILMGIITSVSWADEPLTVRFLDVGYADAILIQSTDGVNGMIDVGGPASAEKIIRSLAQFGVSSLDFVVITHGHLNHFGGLEQMLDHVEIRHVYVNGMNQHGDKGYKEVLSELKADSIPLTELQYEQQIDLNSKDINLVVVHPRMRTGSLNADSLSLVLTHEHIQFWFTSDIQPQGQDQIVRDFPDLVNADCIQVPHHGGKLSPFFESMNPDQVFVVSTGENTYGKPITEFLDAIPGRLLRTDLDGDIVITSDGRSIKVLDE